MFDSYWLSYYAKDLGYLIQVSDFLANHFVGLGASHLPLSPDGKDSGATDFGSIVFYLVSTSKICYSNFVNVSSMYHHALVEYTVLLLNHLISYFHYDCDSYFFNFFMLWRKIFLSHSLMSIMLIVYPKKDCCLLKSNEQFKQMLDELLHEDSTSFRFFYTNLQNILILIRIVPQVFFPVKVVLKIYYKI